VVERYIDIVKVTGSIPVTPRIVSKQKNPRKSVTFVIPYFLVIPAEAGILSFWI